MYKRQFHTKEELIPEEASLLNIANFTPTVHTEKPDDYYPAQDLVERIILDDKGMMMRMLLALAGLTPMVAAGTAEI